MERIFLGLGSNRGDCLATLASALTSLRGSLEVVGRSSVWKSAARYVEDQPPFYNLVVEARTSLEPLALLDLTSGIEDAHGRNRSLELHKGPRSLDIDLLLYGDRILSGERLVLPHPGMTERKFVLLPLLELDRGLTHPATGRSFLDSLAALPPQGIYLFREASYGERHP